MFAFHLLKLCLSSGYIAREVEPLYAPFEDLPGHLWERPAEIRLYVLVALDRDAEQSLEEVVVRQPDAFRRLISGHSTEDRGVFLLRDNPGPKVEHCAQFVEATAV